MKTITFKQLELTMHKDRSGIRNRRQERMARATWWFRKMRQVVDLALPPQPMVSPRPEQTYLQLSSGQGNRRIS